MEKKWIGCAAVNFRAGRPFGSKPEAIVIHIMEGSLSGTDQWFNNPTARVSAHYGVGKQGQVHQCVQEIDTAFHAGTVVDPSWPLLKPQVNPNFYTIGIEHEGHADDIWPEIQIATSAALVAEIAARWAIPLDNQHVIPHHQIRATKTCPGNVIKIEDILARVPVNGGPTIASVATMINLKLRFGQPSTSAPVLRVIPASTTIRIGAALTGETVGGNSNWYSDKEGHYFWAGGTDMPFPSIA